MTQPIRTHDAIARNYRVLQSMVDRAAGRTSSTLGQWILRGRREGQQHQYHRHCSSHLAHPDGSPARMDAVFMVNCLVRMGIDLDQAQHKISALRK
jgi:hypothetical protein